MAHTQTISFTGLQDHGTDGEALALQEIWAIIQAQSFAEDALTSLNSIKTAVAEGTLTVERVYDNSAGTLTITRTWDDDAWTAHQASKLDNTAMANALSSAGITVTGL